MNEDGDILPLEEVENSVVEFVEHWISQAGTEGHEGAWDEVLLACVSVVVVEQVPDHVFVRSVVFVVECVEVSFNQVSKDVQALWGVDVVLLAGFINNESIVDGFIDAVLFQVDLLQR